MCCFICVRVCVLFVEKVGGLHSPLALFVCACWFVCVCVRVCVLLCVYVCVCVCYSL